MEIIGIKVSVVTIKNKDGRIELLTEQEFKDRFPVDNDALYCYVQAYCKDSSDIIKKIN